MVYEYRRPGEVAEWDAEDVAAYLLAHGYAVGGGGVGTGVDGTAALVRADVDRDPTADLDAYQPPPDPIRASKRYLRQRLQAIRQKPLADRQAAPATEQDLVVLVNILRDDL